MPLSLLVPRRERTPRTFIAPCAPEPAGRSEEHTSELQSRSDLVCRLLLEKKKKNTKLKRCRGAHKVAPDPVTLQHAQVVLLVQLPVRRQQSLIHPLYTLLP